MTVRRDSSRVLQICGNPYVGRAVSGMLQAMGFTDIRSVDTAECAFEEILRKQPDIIVADLDVWGVRSAEPARWRGTGSDCEEPVIVFVGRGMRKPEINNADTGNTGVLLRPFDQGMLQRMIDDLLRRRPATTGAS